MRKDDSGKAMRWSLQGGLHAKYASDFKHRNRSEIHCVFGDSLLPGLINELDALQLSKPAVQPPPWEALDTDQLLEQFKEL